MIQDKPAGEIDRYDSPKINFTSNSPLWLQQLTALHASRFESYNNKYEALDGWMWSSDIIPNAPMRRIITNLIRGQLLRDLTSTPA